MRWKVHIPVILLIGLLPAAPAVDWYVATAGTGLGTGINGWADATNNLQGAINMASASTFDVVWVSNGVYDTGGITNYPAGTLLTNRIVIAKSITVRSQNNDPTNTIIKGAWNSAATTNGPAAVRCVYMTSNSWLIGFTLTNGATLTNGPTVGGIPDLRGGGVYCTGTGQIISNCLITGNTAKGEVNSPWGGGGGAYYGALYNCTIVGNNSYGGGGVSYSLCSNCILNANIGSGAGGGANWAKIYNSTVVSNRIVSGGAGGGGGAENSTLVNCALIANRDDSGTGGGGGAKTCYMTNCTLIGNSTVWQGGGANANSILYNCTLISNTAPNNGGGGAFQSTLRNCNLFYNVASWGGGAAASNPNLCYLYNCLLVGNKASGSSGGGAALCYLYNCTVVGNSAATDGGGIDRYALSNSIVYFNSAGTANSNWVTIPAGSFGNTCTAPSTAGWAAGNVTGDPLLVDKGSGYGTNHIFGNYRLAARSPCINAGTNGSWTTTYPLDLDFRSRIRYGAVDMGAYESIRPGTIYGFR